MIPERYSQIRFFFQEWLSMKLQEKKEGAITTDRILKE